MKNGLEIRFRKIHTSLHDGRDQGVLDLETNFVWSAQIPMRPFKHLHHDNFEVTCRGLSMRIASNTNENSKLILWKSALL